MFCKNCGAEIADNAVFCPKCGGKVSQPSNQANPRSAPRILSNTAVRISSMAISLEAGIIPRTTG